MTQPIQVTIDAKPEPLTIDVTRTAVLVIDMKNDFGAKDGMFDRAGIDLSSIRATIEPTARVLAGARSCGIPVVYVQEALSPDLSDIGAEHSPFGRMSKRLGIGQSVVSPSGQPKCHPVCGGERARIFADAADCLNANRHAIGTFETRHVYAGRAERGANAIEIREARVSVANRRFP